MNARVEAQEHCMDDSNMFEQSQMKDGDAGAEEPVENQATDRDDSIIDEPLDLSTVRDRTWSKSKRSTTSQQLYVPPNGNSGQASSVH